MESLRSLVRTATAEEEGNAEEEAVMGLEMDGVITPEFAGRRFDGQDVEAEQTERRLVREWRQFSGTRRAQEVDWRDEFDEDRAGEENFEAPNLVGRRNRNGEQRRTTSEAEDDFGRIEFAMMARTPER